VPLDVPDEVLDESDLLGLAPPDPMPGFRGTPEFGGFADEFDDEDDAPESRRVANPDAASADNSSPGQRHDEDDDALFDE
jgi:hypothetical protein